MSEYYLETYTGRPFFYDGRTNAIDWLDVAHALSMQCRYNGHVHTFYSVAEHACLMSDYTLETRRDHQDALMALHHDDAEAFMGDMVRALKTKLPTFKLIERKIDAAIARRLGLAWPHPSWLKDLDTRIICDERDQAMCASGNKWDCDDLEPLGIVIEFWESEKAKAEWLKRHHQLSSAINAGTQALQPCA